MRPGRNDREERFLEVLRAAWPLWVELDIDGLHAAVVYDDPTVLKAYIDIGSGRGGIATLRVDLDGDTIVGGLSDSSMAHDLDRGAPEAMTSSGEVEALGEAARDWFADQLRRPLVAWEWTTDRSSDGELIARAYLFADTGQKLAWQSANVGVAWQAGGAWGEPAATDRPPDRLVTIRPDRRVTR